MAKAAFARAPLAATIMEEMSEASPHAEARASVAAVDLEAVVVGTDDRMSSYPWSVELGIGEMSHAANDSKHRHMVLSDSS